MAKKPDYKEIERLERDRITPPPPSPKVEWLADDLPVVNVKREWQDGLYYSGFMLSDDLLRQWPRRDWLDALLPRNPETDAERG